MARLGKGRCYKTRDDIIRKYIDLPEWTCPTCQESRGAFRDICPACKYPRPENINLLIKEREMEIKAREQKRMAWKTE